MGLKLTLEKQNNHLCYDFIDAYWVLENIGYDTHSVGFQLNCYPSREAKLNNKVPMQPSGISIGSPWKPVYDPKLYSWEGIFEISSVFPKGIPLDENQQKTTIYNFIKSYTKLPFKDVIEN